MSYFARQKRRLRWFIGVTMCMLVGTASIAMFYQKSWLYVLPAMYAVELALRLRTMQRLHKASQSPFAYLIEVEAACNNGELR